ncbi:MAG: serine/threonine protein kinase [Planctomycetes bacterium]|nr:serine/threonine protein kinase [Planctomycetota bacterium]
MGPSTEERLLCDRAVREGLLTTEALSEALRRREKLEGAGGSPPPLREFLVREGFLSATALAVLARSPEPARLAETLLVPRPAATLPPTRPPGLGSSSSPAPDPPTPVAADRAPSAEAVPPTLVVASSWIGEEPAAVPATLLTPVPSQPARSAVGPASSSVSSPAPAPATGPAASPQPAPPTGTPLDRPFGRHRLLQELGRGGMGIVYKAWDSELGRVVALKVMSGEAQENPEAVGRFRREARSAARLRHPNIVQVHDVGVHEGRPYFTMDFIEGEDLDKAGKRLPTRRFLEVLRDVGLALQAAHDAGLVHRDVKPGNLLLDREGHPYVTDFGLVKEVRANDGAALTLTGAVMGTPRYMSPEQASGQPEEVGPASDLWSLGVILYQHIAGKPPFDGLSVISLLAAVLRQDPTPPGRVSGARRVHRDLETICLKCLEKEPHKRYASARDFSSDLGRFLEGEPIEASPPSAISRAGRWVSRRWSGLAVAGAVVACAVAVGALTLHGRAELRAEIASRLVRLREVVEEARQARRVGNRKRLDGADEAVREETKALFALDANCAAAFLASGRLRALRGMNAQARPDLDRAVALAPEWPLARAERGRVLAVLYHNGVERHRPTAIIDPSFAPDPGEVEKLDPALRELRFAAEADLSAVHGASTSEAEAALLRAYLCAVHGNWPEAATAAETVTTLELSEEAWWLWGLACLREVTDAAGRTHAPAGGALTAPAGAQAGPGSAAAPDRLAEAALKLERATFVGAGFGVAWLARAEARIRLACRRRDPEDVRPHLDLALREARQAASWGADDELVAVLSAQALWLWGEEDRERNEQTACARYREGIRLLEEPSGRFQDASGLYLRGKLWNGLACSLSTTKEDPTEAARRAVELLESALRSDPRYSRAYTQLGHHYVDLADALRAHGRDDGPAFQAAVRCYTEGLAVEPGNPWALQYRGYARFWLGAAAQKRGADPEDFFRAAISDLESVRDRFAGTPGDHPLPELAICHLYLAIRECAASADPMPRLRQAEEAALRDLKLDTKYAGAPNGHGLVLLWIARVLEAAGRPCDAEYEKAGGRFREALVRAECPPSPFFGLAIAEAALARRPGGAEHKARAVEALARFRPPRDEASWALLAPFVCLPFLETLEAGVPDAGGKTDLEAARLAWALEGGPARPEEARRLRDLGFAALERAVTAGITPAALREDPLLAPLRADPRWEKLVGPGGR